jgi:WD40 repeat protein
LAVLTIIVLPNQMIASGSMDRTVRIWDPSQKENHCISILNGHRDAVRALCLIGESKQWLCSGGYDKRILVWDWKNGQMLREIVTSGTVHSLSLMDHARVLASTHDGAIRIWHIRLVNDSVQSDCERVVENTHGALPGTEAAWATLVCGDTSSDHREIQNVISAGLDKRVRVWNVVSALSHSQQANVLSLRADRSLCGHTGGVLSLAFSEVHQVLFSGSQDSTIAVWR